jgi:uncharacterized phage protein (TIGR01671 family)
MEREIKFRGKSVLNDEWIYGDLVHRINSPKTISPVQINGIGVKEDTVGQFTGLFDKNGKEIYEWDILHTITFGFNPEEYTAIILYRNCSFQLSNGRNLFYFGQSDLTKMNDTIVIGNIYDNPDLIKEE